MTKKKRRRRKYTLGEKHLYPSHWHGKNQTWDFKVRVRVESCVPPLYMREEVQRGR
jgi:hypothetical protein